MPGHSGELECHDSVRSIAKRTVHFCDRFNPVTSASAPPPPRPPLVSYSLIALLPPLEAGQTMYRANAIPDRSLAHFNAWALSQLRLHKPFRAAEELSNPDVGQVFDEHLTPGGFPHLRCA